MFHLYLLVKIATVQFVKRSGISTPYSWCHIISQEWIGNVGRRILCFEMGCTFLYKIWDALKWEHHFWSLSYKSLLVTKVCNHLKKGKNSGSCHFKTPRWRVTTGDKKGGTLQLATIWWAMGSARTETRLSHVEGTDHDSAELMIFDWTGPMRILVISMEKVNLYGCFIPENQQDAWLNTHPAL